MLFTVLRTVMGTVWSRQERGPAAYAAGPLVIQRRRSRDQTVNELPQPQPPEALGLLKVKPLPWKVDT